MYQMGMRLNLIYMCYYSCVAPTMLDVPSNLAQLQDPIGQTKLPNFNWQLFIIPKLQAFEIWPKMAFLH